MAAAAAAATATATSSLLASSVADLSSSANAFRTAGSPVQHVPVTSLRCRSGCGRIVAARVTLPVEQPQKFPIRREIVASILAAGTILSSTGSVLADPVAEAKRNVGAAVEDVRESAEKATSEVKGSIDGIFGKGKAPPFNFDGGNGAPQVLDDAKNSVANAPSLTEGAEKATKGVQNVADGTKVSGESDLVPDQSPRSGGASKAADLAGSTLQEKGSEAVSQGQDLIGQAPSLSDTKSALTEKKDEAVDQGKNLVGQAVDMTEARSLPNLIPKPGNESQLRIVKVDSAKGAVSK